MPNPPEATLLHRGRILTKMNCPSKFGSSTGAKSSATCTLSNALTHSTHTTHASSTCSDCMAVHMSQPNEKCTTIKSNSLGRGQAQFVHLDQFASTSSSQHHRGEVASVVNLTASSTTSSSSSTISSSSSNSNCNNLREEEWSAPLKKEDAPSTSAFSKRNANSRDKHHYAIGVKILAELSESEHDDDDDEYMDGFCEDDNEITVTSFYGLEQ